MSTHVKPVIPSLEHPSGLLYASNLAMGYNFDYNNAARVVVSTGLGLIPYAGVVLSALVEIFWPNPETDVWAEIKHRVEALVDQKLSARVFQDVEDKLKGLKGNINEYLVAVKYSKANPQYINTTYVAVQNFFVHDLPSFQSSGYEVLLLPLFAQFVNLHLSLLRDGVLHGAEWGWTPEIQQQNRQRLTQTIQSYSAYADRIYQKELAARRAQTPQNNHLCEPFRTLNRFTREMTLTVLDFKELWRYYDPSAYPQSPERVYLDREIYSDPVGTADDTGVFLPGRAPSKPISRISVWGWDRIDACNVEYPAGGGPDGVTQTGRMGNSSGGSNQPPHGGVFDVNANPVIEVSGFSGDILNAMSFRFKDGSTSNKLGGNYPGGGRFSFSYTDEILSSIRIMGVSRFYGSANCAVFGFKFSQSSPVPTAELMNLFYVSSPETPTPESLLRGFPGTDATARGNVSAWINSYGWEAKREALWAARKAASKLR